MRKIIFILTLLLLSIYCFSQYPNGQQFLGTDSNVVVARGALKARVIPYVYTDTTAANLERIRQYPGAEIYTSSDQKKWYRNQATTSWIQYVSGAISSVNIYNSDGILTGNRFLTGNNNLYGLTLDSLSQFEVKSNVGVQYSHLALSQFSSIISYIGNPSTSLLTATNGDISIGIIGGNEVSVSNDSVRVTTLGRSNDTTNRKIVSINPITGAFTYSNWSNGLKAAGNTHDVQLNRNGAFYGSDSLLYNGLGLVNLNDYTGRALKLSDATASIHSLYIGGVKYLSNFGPTLDNLWFGKNSGSTSVLSTNSQNIGIGINTLQNVQSQGNIAIGTVAGADFTAAAAPATDTKNIFIGYESGTHALGGQNNIAIGSNAGQNFLNGSFSNTAVGKVALGNCTTCFANSIYGASIQLTNGQWNSLLGADIMTAGTSASFNAGIGAFSFSSATGATYNAWVGYGAGAGCISCTGNSILGEHGLGGNGNYNIAIGNYALAYNPTDSYQFGVHAENKGGVSMALIGGDLQNYKFAVNVREDSVRLLTYTMQVNGNMSLHHTNYVDDTTANKIVVWNTTTGLFNRTYWPTSGGGSGITIGTTTISSGTPTRALFDDGGVVGEDAGFVYAKATDALTVSGSGTFASVKVWNGNNAAETTNTSVGNQAGNAITSAASFTALGYRAGFVATSGSQLTLIGFQAGSSNTTGDYNTVVGSNALRDNVSSSGNCAFGVQTLIQSTGHSNSAYGFTSMVSNLGGAQNSAFGYNSLSGNNTGNTNSAFGYNAGASNTSGSNNSYFGYGATGNTTQSNNTVIGAQVNIGAVSDNIAIGTGDGNIRARFASGVWTMSGNITLPTAGNKLNISTGSNASVGVSGAMTAGTITINTTAVTASSLIYLTHATVSGTIGVLSVGTITAGTSFVINSSSATDTGTVNWWIVN